MKRTFTPDKDECLYCLDGSLEPSDYTWQQPYDFEPGYWVCSSCMEEQPWR